MLHADNSVRISWAAVNEATSIHAYGPEVRWRIRQGDPSSYARAAEQLNIVPIDVVCLQHEFGLYGIWGDAFEDHLTSFLEALRKPLVTTLHSVLPGHPRLCVTRCSGSPSGASAWSSWPSARAYCSRMCTPSAKTGSR